MTVPRTRSIEIFYSYASADEALCGQLEKHLANLKQQGLIVEWHNRKILAGSPGADEVDAHLKSASIILLLVSPDFIASPYCYGIEMKEAVRRHESGEVRVIPVILRPVDWAGTPFARLNPLPKNARPITKWSPRDEGFLNVATGIREIVEQVKQTFAPSVPQEETQQSRAGSDLLTPQPPSASVSQNISTPEIERTASYLHIRSVPPLTDHRTIQQREPLVRDLYAKLTQPNITAIALTGISGVGKSTLAALLYHYAEKQRSLQNSPFQFPALWLTIDPAVTFADLVGNVFEALGVPLPNLSNLAPSNQALVLFNALNRAEKARLVILDQFENLLDWDTGRAQADRPGVGEWLDIINSQPCACRLLLTSRPRPIGTREYPLTYMQEYAVGGLETNEGVDMLQSQGVVGAEGELRQAVEDCAGHAFALTLLVSLARDYSISLSTLFKDAALWTGDIATNLLDRIYTHKLNGTQKQVLLAFSAYREPVSLDAVVATIPVVKKIQITNALKVLRTQRLLEAAGENRYRLHAIIADYAQNYLDDGGEMVRAVHARAAQYYLQRAAVTCPPWKQRRSINDVHDLIEAIWQHCQAEQWQEAYTRVQEEGFVEDLKHWGGNAILLEVYQLLLPLEKWQPDTLQKVQIYNDLGWIYNDLGQKQQALEYYKRAMEISEKAGIQNGKGRLLSNIGSVYDGWGERIQAVEYYKQSLPLYQKAGDHKGEAWVLNSLGRAYMDFGQLEQAKLYLDQAFRSREEAGDRGGMGRTLNNLGVLSIRMGNREEALNFLKEALSLLKDVGDLNGQSRTLHRLGQLYNAFGQQEEALNHYEQALDIRITIGDRRGEGRVLGNIGLVYCELGQYQQAWEYYKRALPLCRETEDYETEGRVLYRLGLLFLNKPDYDVATAFFLLARNVFDKIKNLEIRKVGEQLDSLRQQLGDERFDELSERVSSQQAPPHQAIEQVWIRGW